MTAPCSHIYGPVVEILDTHDNRISVSGDMDMSTGRTLLDAVDELLCADDDREVLVDLAAVSFVDCAGLGAVVQAVAAGRERGRTVTIESSSRAVDNLALLTGMRHLFPTTQPAPIRRRRPDPLCAVQSCIAQRPAA